MVLQKVLVKGLGIVLPKADTIERQAASALKQLKEAREAVKMLPSPDPSEPARRFQDELQALIDNPGENFRRAVSELLQARTDAPETLRLQSKGYGRA